MGDVRVRPSEWVLAVVTIDRSRTAGGGAPIFYARDEGEAQRIALLLSRTTLGSIHEIVPGTYIVMRH